MTPSETSPPDPPEGKSATRQLEEDFGGDIPMVLMVLDVFIETVPDLLAKLKAALEQSDISAAGRVSHSLKGALAQVQAEIPRDLAFEIEHACKNGDLKAAAAPIPKLEKTVMELLREMGIYKLRNE